jgi:cobalt/nickel transport system permease protein
MALLTVIDAPSPIHRVDPRARLVACAWLVALAAALRRPEVLAALLAGSIALTAGLRLPWPALRGRVLAVNAFLAVLALTAPLAPAMPEGARPLLAAALKANAIVLLVTALVSTIDVVTLGHALAHLRLPRKLVHLFLFTVRYTEVLHAEHERLRRAARARGFRPRPDRHTYRVLAALAGMLLVRSLDRAERVQGAMRCRGFRGEFHLLHHFHYGRADALFGLIALAAGVLLGLWEFA